jgi:uncharacterized delta-60 repeat protein
MAPGKCSSVKRAEIVSALIAVACLQVSACGGGGSSQPVPQPPAPPPPPPAGELDATFGDAGKVVTDIAGSTLRAWGGALQADGKILVAGELDSSSVVARYEASGVLDMNFGVGGLSELNPLALSDTFDVKVQSDNKIVLFGAAGGRDFTLIRVNADGSPDTTFGVDGIVNTDFDGGSEAFAGAIQTDGKIVAAGGFFNPALAQDDFAVARYEADGSLDPGFGVDGKVLVDFGGIDYANAVAIQADGKIIVAGKGGPNLDFATARLNADGTLDPTFGNAGKVLTDFGDNEAVNDLGLQTDGKILAIGRRTGWLAVVRYLADGSLDQEFNGSGIATTETLDGNIQDGASITIQSNGKIIAGGLSFREFDESFAVVRFLTDGSVDSEFGTNGVVLTDFGDPADVGVLCPPARRECSSDILRTVAIQTDGKIVAIGGAGEGTPTFRFALSRYHGDPPSTAVKAKMVRETAGTIAVTLISSGNFDATQVDATRTYLGPHKARATQEQPVVSDVDGDGDADLTLRFNTTATGIGCSDNYAVLDGELFTDEGITGSSSIADNEC